MPESLFSESWYRVADLKPRLRSHVQVHRHTYRGRDWYVMEDHASGRFHRFSHEAYCLIGLMDGKRTLGEIWEAACARLGNDMPTQEEVIRLLSQLHRSDVLQTDIPPDLADLHQRSVREKRALMMGRFASPFAIRIPLFDPDPFLSGLRFVTRPLYGWAGILVWTMVVGAAAILAAVHWQELTLNVSDRVLAMENLFLLYLAYPIVKALHELAHACTVKHWGGEVHDMGLMLLVFVPVPYVDATSSTAFWEKRKRMMVGGAGILMELFLASLAMLIWVSAEPGAVRSLAFNVMVIGGVSTILFNGNPLLRFDAYYVLSDWLEIPNLAMRANRYLGYLSQRYLLNLKDAHNPASTGSEKAWLGFYATASFIYRIFITFRIAMFVAGKFLAVGFLLAAWGLFSMLALPLTRMLRFAFTDPALQPKRTRVLAVAAIAIAIAVSFLLAVPLPSYTVAEGVIWAPENSRVHSGGHGFVKRLVAIPGQGVKKGDPLIVCENPQLDAEVEILSAQLREFELRHRQSMVKDRTEAEILLDEIGRIRAELQQKRMEVQDLVVRSPAEGLFLIASPEDLPDRFVKKGSPVGFIVDFSRLTARVVVPQRDVDKVRTDTRRVLLRPSESPEREFSAEVCREVPAASNELPSMALSLDGGGSLALDPRERQEPRAFETLFHFEIQSSELLLNVIGERIFVRFEHAPEPLAYRWYRDIRRTLMSRFNV